MKATIVKKEWKHLDQVRASEMELEAPTNDLSFTIKDESIRKEYDKWISNIHNYAANGGNMD